VAGRVGAGFELAGNRRSREHRGVGDQGIDRVDAGVEVVLDDVVVATVGVGDLRRDVALGDPVDVAAVTLSGLTMLLMVSFTPLTSWFQPPTKRLALARFSSSPSAAALDDDVGLREQVASSRLLRLFLMILYCPCTRTG
jgi:hypothetical protein